MKLLQHRTQLERDALRQKDRNARADAEEFDVRNRPQPAEEIFELFIAEQQRVTTAEFDDCPADYSPNGRRLLVSNGQLSVVESNGNGLHKITPDGMEVDFCSGSWSPQGNQIAFSAKVPDTDRSTIWFVHSDGSGLHKIPVPGCGGPRPNPTSIGCQKPVWSPDGRKIMFERHFKIPNDHYDLYTVNPDGSGLFQVANTPDLDEGGGDWGTHPLTP